MAPGATARPSLILPGGAAANHDPAPRAPRDPQSEYAAPSDAYLPGDIVLARDGRTQYQIQSDGSWKKLAAPPSVEDAHHARAHHAKDHRRVAAAKLEKRSGLLTPESDTSSPLILGADAAREYKKLTGGR